MVLTDGAAHAVDSSDLAFRLASVYAFREAANGASPVVMEPVMGVEVTVPSEFQVWTLLMRPAAAQCINATRSSAAYMSGGRFVPSAGQAGRWILSAMVQLVAGSRMLQ